MASDPRDPVKVRISPSSVRDSEASLTRNRTAWVAQGFPLSNLLAMVFSLNPLLIDVPVPLSDHRLDVIATIPPGMTEEMIYGEVQQALTEQLHLRFMRQTRRTRVQAMKAPRGPGPRLTAHPEPVECIFVKGIVISNTRISADNVTMAALADALSFRLHSLVVDETNLSGRYDVDARSTGADNREAFIDLLAQALGLVLMQAVRVLPFLEVRTQ